MTRKVQKALVLTLYCMFLFLKCEEINLKTVMMLLFFCYCFLFQQDLGQDNLQCSCGYEINALLCA